MLLSIDETSGVPLYRQIADALRRAIQSGAYAAGTKLPPAREIARALDVNMHTVLKAYGQLGDEGLVSIKRGRGATVVSAGERGDVAAAVRKAVAAARDRGLTRSQLVSLVEEQWK